MAWPRPRAAALALLLAPHLASADGRFVCPAKGGPAWREFRSEHVVLRTDLAPEQAREMIAELELARAAVLHALFSKPPAIPSVLHAVAFSDQDDFRAVSSQHAQAYFTNLRGLTPTVVLPGTLGSRTRATLVHELTHHLSSFPLLRKPMWLNEGFAVYLESIGSTSFRTRMTVGTVPEGRRILREAAPVGDRPMVASGQLTMRVVPMRVPVRDVLAWRSMDPTWSQDTAVRHYESSWLLVHYLVNRQPTGFDDLLRRLGRAEDPRLAWKGAFPKWDPDVKGALDDLEGELDDYARGTKFQYHTLDLKVSPRVDELPLPSAEVHVLRAQLLPVGGEKRTEVLRAEIDEALAEDPGNPAAVATLVALDPATDALPMARMSVETHRGDWLAHRLLADALPAGPEQLAAGRRSVELAPSEPLALLLLARDLVKADLPKEAAPLVVKAAGMAPYASVVHETVAEVAIRLGFCEEALRSQQRALDTLSDRVTAKERKRQEGLLEGYQGRCAAAPR